MALTSVPCNMIREPQMASQQMVRSVGPTYCDTVEARKEKVQIILSPLHLRSDSRLCIYASGML